MNLDNERMGLNQSPQPIHLNNNTEITVCNKNNEISVDKYECKTSSIEESHPYLIKKQIKLHRLVTIENSKIKIPLYNIDKEVVGYQIIDSDSDKKFSEGTKKIGNFFILGNLKGAKQAFIVEGYATGASVYESSNTPVIVAFDVKNIASVIKSIKKLYPELDITIAADNDCWKIREGGEVVEKPLNKNIGLQTAYEVAKEHDCEVVYPEFPEVYKNQTPSDFNDLYCLLGTEEVKRQLAIFPPAPKIIAEMMEDPEPIEFSLHEIESPNIDFLGDNIITRFVKEVSRSTETPLEFALFGVFSAISTCVMGKVFVKIKDDYIEPIILSTIILAKSGEGKTPVYNHVMKPILEKQKKYREEYQIKFKEFQHQNKLMEEKIRRLKDGVKKNNIEVNVKDVMDIENEKIGEPVDPTITAQDITPEQITNKLVRQGGRIAIIDHEGGIFDTIAGRYSNNGTANTDVFTKGYNGSELKVDRGEKSVDLDNAYVLLLIFLQPNIFKKTKNFDHFLESGFFARTLFLSPKSKVEFRTDNEPSVNAEIKNKYNNFIQGLMSYKKEDNSNYKYLKFSKDSKEMYIDFCTSIAKERAVGGDFEGDSLGGWAEKLKGNTARLAGILHIIENPPINDSATTKISKETLNKAIQLSVILIDHAKIVFNSIGTNTSTKDAIDLWNYIENKKLDSFTESEILQKRKQHQRLSKKDNMTLALKVLIERSVILEVGKYR